MSDYDTTHGPRLPRHRVGKASRQLPWWFGPFVGSCILAIFMVSLIAFTLYIEEVPQPGDLNAERVDAPYHGIACEVVIPADEPEGVIWQVYRCPKLTYSIRQVSTPAGGHRAGIE